LSSSGPAKSIFPIGGLDIIREAFVGVASSRPRATPRKKGFFYPVNNRRERRKANARGGGPAIKGLLFPAKRGEKEVVNPLTKS